MEAILKLLVVRSNNSISDISKNIKKIRKDIEIHEYPYSKLKKKYDKKMAMAGISHTVLQFQIDVILFFDDKDFYVGFISQFTNIDIRTILLDKGSSLHPEIYHEVSVLISTKYKEDIKLSESLKLIHAEKFSAPIYGSRNMIIEEKKSDLAKQISFFIKENCESMNFDGIMDNYQEISRNILNNKFEDLWLSNIKVNKSQIEKPIEENMHDNQIGYVFSNGPSFERFYNHCCKYGSPSFQGHVLATNGAFRLLNDLDISPDYLCIVHPEDNQYERQIKGVDQHQTKLLIASTIHPSTYRDWDLSRIYWYHAYNNDKLSEVCNDINLPTLEGGISIATLSAGFFIYQGCSKIIFVGQDFAYTRNEKYYNVPLKLNDAMEGSIYGTDDLHGNMVLTSMTLERSRDIIIAMSLHYDGKDGRRKIEFINASEEGILYDGNIIQEEIKNIL